MPASTHLMTDAQIQIASLPQAWRPIFERVSALPPTAREAVAWSITLRRAARKAGVPPIEAGCSICVGWLVAALPGGSVSVVTSYEQALREVAAAERAMRRLPGRWAHADAA